MSLTRTQFEEELEKLRNHIIAMGSLVDGAVAGSMEALAQRDIRLAELVIDADDAIDEMDLSIEAECMRLLALQHPLARDLRLVGTALKIITDLERIADHAVDIAKVALDAFVRHDLNLVEVAVRADDEVDELFHHVRDDLHAAMRRDPEVVVEASYLLFVSHYLERMADHAVNIAERVYFVETGQLARTIKA